MMSDPTEYYSEIHPNNSDTNKWKGSGNWSGRIVLKLSDGTNLLGGDPFILYVNGKYYMGHSKWEDQSFYFEKSDNLTSNWSIHNVNITSQFLNWTGGQLGYAEQPSMFLLNNGNIRLYVCTSYLNLWENNVSGIFRTDSLDSTFTTWGMPVPLNFSGFGNEDITWAKIHILPMP